MYKCSSIGCSMKRCLCISTDTSRGNDRHNLACASSAQSYLKSLSHSPAPPPPRSSTRRLHFNYAAASVILSVLTPQLCSSHYHLSSTTRLLRSGTGGDNDNGDQFWHDFALKRGSYTSPIAGLTRPSISHTNTLPLLHPHCHSSVWAPMFTPLSRDTSHGSMLPA